MEIKRLEKRYNKLVNKTFSQKLTEQEYEKAMKEIHTLEIQMLKLELEIQG